MQTKETWILTDSNGKRLTTETYNSEGEANGAAGKLTESAKQGGVEAKQLLQG